MRADELSSHPSPLTQLAELSNPLPLESGAELPQVRIAYRTWGALNERGDNAVVICHALTGSADADNWWAPLFGPGKALDPERDYIVCSNILGSCYGTTGPLSTNPATGQPYGPDFPQITVRDMVRVQAELLRALGVRSIQMVIGGSLGGMQALEWAAMYPELVRSIVPIAVSGWHSAWCIALSEAQRQAIFADPRWNGGRYSPEDPPVGGLAAARMMAMCSYRSRASFDARFGRTSEAGRFSIESYLHRHGEKLVRRFDANSYVTLTRAMDTHDLSRGRGEQALALRRITAPALVISIDSDVLYPPEEQRELTFLLGDAELATLHSPHGHDAFLIDMDEVEAMVRRFRSERVERRAQAAAGARRGRARQHC